MANRYKSIVFQMFLPIMLVSFSVSCFVSIIWFPLLLFYPAVLSVIILLIVNILEVFYPTPNIEKLSSKLNMADNIFDAPCQLLLTTFMWLTSGEMHLSAMMISIFFIGKVSTEQYLMDKPEDLLNDKSFTEKITLMLRFMPLFSLTAFFRCGAFVVFLIDYHKFRIINTEFSILTLIFLTLFYTVVVYLSFMLMFFGWRRTVPELREMSVMEVTTSMVGELTTVTTWGSLGRRGARRIQMVMNTLLLLVR